MTNLRVCVGVLQEKLRARAPFIVLAVIVVAMMSPVLFDGRPGILDAPIICEVCRASTWTDPGRLFNIMGFDNQARPLQFLAFLPALVQMQPRYFHLFQNGLVLLLTIYVAMCVVEQFVTVRWLAVVAVACAMLTPAFTANYYTLWTMEPYMQFGLYGVLFVLVRLLGAAQVGRGAWWWYNGIGVVFAAYAIGVKEPGVMVFVVCVAAGVVLARLERRGWREALRRCWPVGLAALLVFGAVVGNYLTNATAYDAGGRGGYALAPAALLQSLRRFVMHFLDTASYAILAVPVWLFALLMQEQCAGDDAGRRALTRAVTGAAMFFSIAAGMAAIYVPWQVFDARYLLLASSSAVLATVLVIRALALIACARVHVVWQLLALNLAVVLGVLLGLHVLFTLVVEPLSRGLVTHKVACAYDDMFRYVAAQAPSNGVAYFIMDRETTEPVENTYIGMRVLYARPDIYCAFPQTRAEFGDAGLVAAAAIHDFSFNYSRMPVHARAGRQFAQWARSDNRFQLVTSFVYRTPVVYVRAEYNVPQYKAWWGIPAFWELKRGVYHFGWNVYRFQGSGAGRPAAALPRQGVNLLRDSDFAHGFTCWEARDAVMTQAVTFVAADAPDATTAMQLAYRRGPRLHVRQHAAMEAGAVYRLSGMAKMVAPAYPEVLGARLALYMPSKKDVKITWDYVRAQQWELRQVMVTNDVCGDGVVYIELGGRAARDVQVTDVRLEKLTGGR